MATYLPYQPVYTKAGSPTSQVSPYQYYPAPSPYGDLRGTGDVIPRDYDAAKRALEDLFFQVLPTSMNLRNLALSGALEDLGKVAGVENIVGAQEAGKAVGQRYERLEGGKSNLAARGLLMPEAMRAAIEAAYINDIRAGQKTARTAGTEARNQLMNQIYGITQSDLDYIRTLMAAQAEAEGRTTPSALGNLGKLVGPATALTTQLFKPPQPTPTTTPYDMPVVTSSGSAYIPASSPYGYSSGLSGGGNVQDVFGTQYKF